MKKKQKKNNRSLVPLQLVASELRKGWIKRCATLLVLAGAGICIVTNSTKYFHKAMPEQVANAQELKSKYFVTMNELLALSPSKIEHCDIALMDLL